MYHLGFALKNQRPIQVQGRLCSYMLDFPLPFISKKVKAQAVCFRVDQITETLLEKRPSSMVYLNFKDGKLYALPVVTTCLRDSTQTALTT